jgi:hypothetical protein
MQTKPQAPPPPVREPTDDAIRDYAFHLYQQSGCVPGHDLENWLEAKACLAANLPRELSPPRQHRLRRHALPAASPAGFFAFTASGPAFVGREDPDAVGRVVVEEFLLIQPPDGTPR